MGGWMDDEWVGGWMMSGGGWVDDEWVGGWMMS